MANLKGSLSGPASLANLSASLSASRKTNNSSNVHQMLILHSKKGFSQKIDSTKVKLTEEAQRVLREFGFKYFTERYGTHYVAIYHQGAAFTCIVTITSKDKSAANSINADIKANFLVDKAEASLGADFDSAKK
jgi:hypothetical protein